jgi:hypothetical protein
VPERRRGLSFSSSLLLLLLPPPPLLLHVHSTYQPMWGKKRN